MSKTAAELLLEPFGDRLSPHFTVERGHEGFVLVSEWRGQLCDGMTGPDAAALAVVLNALPKLAAVCAAAEKMRANAFGGPCPCESPVCTSLRAFDAALADLTAALSSGGRHARA